MPLFDYRRSGRLLIIPLRLISRFNHLRAEIGLGGLWHRALMRMSPHHRAYRRRKRQEDDAFDAVGYDTGGTQYLHTLTLFGGDDGAAGVHHSAVSPIAFARSIDALDIDLRCFTFIDIGSGKGRAVMLAAERPFARIIGVEFALELHQQAERNIALRDGRGVRDARIELVYANATTFRYPDQPTVLFLYNPFDPPVLTAVIDQALASWRSSPRPFRVVYVNPVHLDAWTEAGWTLLSADRGAAIYAPPGG